MDSSIKKKEKKDVEEEKNKNENNLRSLGMQKVKGHFQHSICELLFR